MIKYNPQFKSDGTQNGALTSAPSDSIIFDVPGKCIWVKGVKLLGTDHTYSFSNDNYITLTNTPGDPEDIKIGVNINNLLSELDKVRLYIGENNNTAANAQVGNPYIKLFYNNVRKQTFLIKSANDTNLTVTTDSDGNIIIENKKPDLNHNTDYRVSQLKSTDASNFRVLLKSTADDNNETNSTKYSQYLTFNPNTKILKINSSLVVTMADIYVGATSSANATVGLVPAAASANRNKFLRGDGTWQVPTNDNTWRPVKVEGTQKLASTTDTDALDFHGDTGIEITYDATNKKINIKNTAPDVNHNTDRTGLKKGTAGSTATTGLVITNSASGLIMEGGTHKFKVGDGTNFFEIPITVTNLSLTAISALSSFIHASDLIYAAKGGGNTVTDKPSGVDAFGVISMKTADGWYGQLLMSSDTASGVYWRTAISLSGGWKLIADSGNISNKDATIGTSSTTIATIAGVNITAKIGSYAASNHTHPLSIAADSGTSSIALAASTKYKLTAGGSTYVFTSTPDENVRQVPKTDNVNRPLMMINGGTSQGEQVNTSMFSTGIYANASTKMITANGFVKVGSDSSHVLLGDGDHKALSDFSMAHSHPYSYLHLSDWDYNVAHNSNYVTFDKSNGTGGPTNSWYNGFVTTHNNYLSSYLVNEHRTHNWYLGWNLNSETARWTKVLTADNTNISNGVITINGVTITPLTSHQSLANYVTLVDKTDDTTNHWGQLRYVKNNTSYYFTSPYSEYARALIGGAKTTDLNSVNNNENRIYWHEHTASNAPVANYGNMILFSNVTNPKFGTSEHWITQIDFIHLGGVYHRDKINTDNTRTWSRFYDDDYHPISLKADQLTTARTIWGQSFDGTSNVSGNLTFLTGSGGMYGFVPEASGAWRLHLYTEGVARITVRDSGQVGIGNSNPGTTYKLDVSGNLNGTTLYLNGSPINSLFVSSLGVDGNYLTWTKNGSVNKITIPYSVNSNQLNSRTSKYYTLIYCYSIHNNTIKVGTVECPLGGHTLVLRFYTGIGYNANVTQHRSCEVIIRAANGDPGNGGLHFSIQTEGHIGGTFATFYMHQLSTTKYEIWMSAYNYSGGSFYEVVYHDGITYTNNLNSGTLPTSNIIAATNYNISYSGHTHTWDSITSKPAAIGGATNPVYWNGSGFVEANSYPTKSSWNYDDIYLKLSGGTIINTSTETPLGIKGKGSYSTILFSTNDGHYRRFGIHGSNAELFVTDKDGWNQEYNIATAENSSVSKSGETLTVKILGTSQSLTNTWRDITNDYNPTTPSDSTSLSLTGAKNLYTALLNGPANSLNCTKQISVTPGAMTAWTWYNTGIAGSTLSNGIYLLRISISTNGPFWSCNFVGLLYWFSSGTNASEADEIIMHSAGHANNSNVHIYIRTLKREYSTLLMLMTSNINLSAYTYTFRFFKIGD